MGLLEPVTDLVGEGAELAVGILVGGAAAQLVLQAGEILYPERAPDVGLVLHRLARLAFPLVHHHTSTAHGGGRRWAKGSPQYQTILDWVRGASAVKELPAVK